MNYSSFDEILTITPVNEEARIAYTKQWLEKNYGIKKADSAWLSSLSSVHDHDNMPLHFGETSVGTAFTKMGIALTKVGATWHLGVSRNGQTQGEVIHPKSEASYNENSNQKLRLSVVALLSNGKLQQNAGRAVAAPAPVSSDTIYQKEDEEARIAGNLGTSAPVNTLNAKTKSVGIDLSAYL